MLCTIIVNAFACFFFCFLLYTPVEEEGLRNLWSGVTPAILRHIGKLYHSNTPLLHCSLGLRGFGRFSTFTEERLHAIEQNLRVKSVCKVFWEFLGGLKVCVIWKRVDNGHF